MTIFNNISTNNIQDYSMCISKKPIMMYSINTAESIVDNFRNKLLPSSKSTQHTIKYRHSDPFIL